VVDRFGALDDGEVVGDQRHREFQELIRDIVQLSYLPIVPTLAANLHNATLTIEWQSHPCWIEANWINEVCDSSTLDGLLRKHVSGQHGIVIAIAGFSDGARDLQRRVRDDRRVILLERDEIASIIDGAVRIETLVDERFEDLARS
jgi:hypothetical protein